LTGYLNRADQVERSPYCIKSRRIILKNQFEIFISKISIPLVETETVGFSLFGCIGMRVKSEIKSPGNQFIPVHFLKFFRPEVAKDSPVSSQYILDISDEVVILPVHPVMIVVPAKIRTELFIRPSF